MFRINTTSIKHFNFNHHTHLVHQRLKRSVRDILCQLSGHALGVVEFSFSKWLKLIQQKQLKQLNNNNNNNNLRIYIVQFSWRDDQLRITTVHGIKKTKL